MKKLILIRHAKSSWEGNVQDFDRPISRSGSDAAIKVAELSKTYIESNSLILISASKRTTETAQIFASIWNIQLTKENFSKDLYTFDLFQLEKIVKSFPNDSKNCILFGHNSAITDFVNKFGDIFIDNVPTSGFVLITFEVDHWNKINKGKTEKIIFPRNI
jgi:phosphohistidine phosphatase